MLSDQQACPKCSKVLPLSDFYPSAKGKSGHYCIACKKATNRAAYLSSERGVFETQMARRAKYGVSVRSLNAMYKGQKGRCAACQTASLDSDSHRWVQPDRDQNGVVMALICLPCHRLLQTLARHQAVGDGGNLSRLVAYFPEAMVTSLMTSRADACTARRSCVLT